MKGQGHCTKIKCHIKITSLSYTPTFPTNDVVKYKLPTPWSFLIYSPEEILKAKVTTARASVKSSPT